MDVSYQLNILDAFGDHCPELFHRLSSPQGSAREEGMAILPERILFLCRCNFLLGLFLKSCYTAPPCGNFAWRIIHVRLIFPSIRRRYFCEPICGLLFCNFFAPLAFCSKFDPGQRSNLVFLSFAWKLLLLLICSSCVYTYCIQKPPPTRSSHAWGRIRWRLKLLKTRPFFFSIKRKTTVVCQCR